jgi:uncharacterized protein HemX
MAVRSPRIRLPKVTLPGRSRPAAARTAVKGDEKAAATNAPEKAPDRAAPAPNLQERMEGLQGWMAEIERKQGRITYFGAVALLIAILASGAALYFGITAKDDSSGASDDLDQLSTKVDGLQQAVSQSTKETQDTINNSISQLQTSIADLQRKQAQDAANISTLQSQAQAGAFNKPGAATPAPAPAPGTPTTPAPNPKP